jgi:predicted SnoaL-like aldol condensation-catalyzing enzyme
MNEVAKSVVIRYFSMWNTGDTTDAENLVVDGYVDHSRSDVTDGASLRAAVEELRSSDPRLHVFVDAVLGDGNMLTVIGRVRSTTERGEVVRDRTWTVAVTDRITEIWRY